MLQPGASTPTQYVDIHLAVLSGGERGLLGLAFHPQYATNGRFFVFYTRAGDGALVISELGVSSDPNVADRAETVLLVIPHPANSNHNGGMIAFGADGYLYLGVGDGGSGNDPANNAQDLDALLGKILRIDVDRAEGGARYASPPDNPFVGVAGRDEIFSIGWRNPWRFSFDRATQQMWVADVGQGARELYVVDLGGTLSRIVGDAAPPPPENPLPENPPAECTFSLSPPQEAYGRGGGTGSVAVEAPDGCSWTAVSNTRRWIRIVVGASGSGNGTVTYSVGAITGSRKARQGTATIAGRLFLVTQSKQ